MAYIPTKRRALSPAASRLVLSELRGGLCIDADQSALSELQSPDMLNMWYKDGTLCSRDGQAAIHSRAVYKYTAKSIFPHYPLTPDKLGSFTALGGAVVGCADGCITFGTAEGISRGVAVNQPELIGGRTYQFRVLVSGMVSAQLSVNRGAQVLASTAVTLPYGTQDFIPLGVSVTLPSDGEVTLALTDTARVAGYTARVTAYRTVDVTDAFENYAIRSPEDIAEADFVESCDFLDEFTMNEGMEGDGSGQSGGSSLRARGAGLNGRLSELYYDHIIFHAGTRLYAWSGSFSEMPRIISLTGLADRESLMFRFMDDVYICDEEGYYRLDRDFALTEVVPYVPIIAINCSANMMSSSPQEQFNMIGRGFCVWYNCDGRVYKLPYGDLADDDLSVEVDNVSLAKSAYTVDRAQGVVTLSANPSAGGINTVRITAYVKPNFVEESRNVLYSCKISCVFGGFSSLGTRVILSGNPDKGAYYYRSGLLDPTYFPDMEYEIVGTGSERITALAQQYGSLIALCERSVYSVNYTQNDGVPLFSCKQINARVGCDIPESVQLIDNRLVFANTSGGVWIIDRIDGTDERNIKPISANINGSRDLGRGLLCEDFTQRAASADHGGRYYLLIGERAYVWDYALAPYYDSAGKSAQSRLTWYLFDNIKASCLFTAHREGRLAFVSSYDGGVGAFCEGAGDMGSDLRAHYLTKSYDFGSPELVKCINSFVVSSNSGGGCNFALELMADGVTYSTHQVRNSDFSWASFNWAALRLSAERYLKSVAYRVIPREGVYHAMRFVSLSGGFNLVKVVLSGGVVEEVR